MKLLLGRTFYGFGDWVMFTSLIKHINVQYPDIVVDMYTGTLPLQFLQYVCYFDVRVTPVAKPDTKKYNKTISHVSYGDSSKMTKHLLESMIETLNTKTNLDIRYDPEHCLAKYIGPKTPITDAPAKFVIVAPENSKAYTSQIKAWGDENFQTLVTTLSKKINVVQVSAFRIPMLTGCIKQVTGLSLGQLLAWMEISRAVVSLENGISHFAGHHGIRTYTIYRPAAPTKPSNAYYPNQVAVCKEVIDPVLLAETIIKDIETIEATQEVRLI